MSDDLRPMPDPERTDALADGDPPRDATERELVAMTAALREATPGASDDLRRRVEAIAARAQETPPAAPERPRWLPWGAVAAAGLASVAGMVFLTRGGDTHRDGGLAMATAPLQERAGDASAAPDASSAPGAPTDADASAAAPTAPGAPAQAAPPAAAPRRTKAAPAPTVVVDVPRTGQAGRIDAALAWMRGRGLVMGHGRVTVTPRAASYTVSVVPAGRADDLRTGVRRAVAVGGVPVPGGVGTAVVALVRTPGDAARRARLSRAETAAGATPPPIASPGPTSVVLRLAR